MKVRYFKLNKDTTVICELRVKSIRFVKWVWLNGICQEQYKFKELTDEFFNSFTEINSKEYHNIWGSNLEKA